MIRVLSGRLFSVRRTIGERSVLEKGSEEIIRKSAQALTSGGRLVILDLKLATGALSCLNPLGVLITKPFVGSYEAGQRKPWEEMQKHLTGVQVEERYFGLIYIASGTKE